jgi:hypothetical protein
MDIIQEGRVEGKIPLSLPRIAVRVHPERFTVNGAGSFIKGDFPAKRRVYSGQLTVYSLGKALRQAQGEGERGKVIYLTYNRDEPRIMQHEKK